MYKKMKAEATIDATHRRSRAIRGIGNKSYMPVLEKFWISKSIFIFRTPSNGQNDPVLSIRVAFIG